MQSVKALINAIEARDIYTRGHSEHVAKLCSCICDNLPSKYKKNIDKDMLNYAGYLHDIGKIGIPEDILNKKGSLNEEEWKVIKRHPLVGKNIVNSIEQFSSISEWIYYHHERIDGKGYYNIKNENIPLEAKIISIADCFSALVTDRAYRKGKSYDEAISIMKSISGMQLDSSILEIFFKIDKETIEKCRPNLLKKNL